MASRPATKEEREAIAKELITMRTVIATVGHSFYRKGKFVESVIYHLSIHSDISKPVLVNLDLEQSYIIRINSPELKKKAAWAVNAFMEVAKHAYEQHHRRQLAQAAREKKEGTPRQSIDAYWKLQKAKKKK